MEEWYLQYSCTLAHFHGCFSHFLSCTNVTKQHKASQILSILFNPFLFNVFILFPLKTPEKLWFFQCFKGSKNGNICQKCLKKVVFISRVFTNYEHFRPGLVQSYGLTLLNKRLGIFCDFRIFYTEVDNLKTIIKKKVPTPTHPSTGRQTYGQREEKFIDSSIKSYLRNLNRTESTFLGLSKRDVQYLLKYFIQDHKQTLKII